MPRRLKNWLKSLATLTRNTEAPDHFWLWSGLFTIGSALNRKVWIKYGIENVRPNFYAVLVAPPGRCRKGGPIKISKQLLKGIGASVSVDSTSKESLTKEMAAAMTMQEMPGEGVTNITPFAIIAKEFSDILAVDPKKMIEMLTSIYDDQDDWEYKVKSDTPHKIYAPCISFFVATTPGYLAENLPYQAFGGGFFSRTLFIVGSDPKQRIPRPSLSEEDLKLMEDLLHDLGEIAQIKGEIGFTKEGGELFDEWYYQLDKEFEQVSDERLASFVERAHIQVLKTAISLKAAETDFIILEPDDIGRAIDLVRDVFKGLSNAFGGLGRSDLSIQIHTLLNICRQRGETSLGELSSATWRNIRPDELRVCLEAMRKMGYIEATFSQRKPGEMLITWKGKEVE